VHRPAAIGPYTADVLQHAPFALGWVRTAWALSRDAEMAKREVVFYRILGIEFP